MSIAGILQADDVLETANIGRMQITHQSIVQTHNWRVVPTVPGPILTSLTGANIAIRNRWHAQFLPRHHPLYEALESQSRVIIGATKILFPIPGPLQHPAVKVYGDGTSDLLFASGSLAGVDDLPLFNAVSVKVRYTAFSKYWRAGHRFSPVPMADVVLPDANLLKALAIIAWDSAFNAYRQPIIVAGNATLIHGQFSPSHLAWIAPPLSAPAFSFSDSIGAVTTPYVRSQLTRQFPHVP